MATIVLSALGGAIGASFGGSFLGLSTAVIGRAIGATIGNAIDQRLMGGGSSVVESARVDRFRLMGASEGTPVLRLWGRTRVGGQVIWATRFKEHLTETTQSSGGQGKGGGPPKQTVTTRSYSYSVSLAVALCEGRIVRVGRVWADGAEIEPGRLNMRVYAGSEDQLPDPLIAAVEGVSEAPAYRGIAYAVIEGMDLTPFGNRVPHLTFEVLREAEGGEAQGYQDVIRGVALVPGTGEYALATTPVSYPGAPGQARTANTHSPGGGTDFTVSMRQLREELPACRSLLVVASWFGSDLRCGHCRVKPKVEQRAVDGTGMPWRVSGLSRAAAETVPLVDGRSVYGGTPADAAVIEALAAIRAAGQGAVFYPFILMEQIAGNGLTDPYSGGAGQPVLPWRGRITLSAAPGRPGSPDGTAAAEAEVAAFFGQAQSWHFQPGPGGVTYSGPADWGYRRMILHYAHLCAAAGGVDAFCIGSEMRGLTTIRGAGGSFPAVAALKALAADVRAILGPATRIGYAADWSEYFGYHPQDGSGDVRFHLDPLWADPNVDFIGIDNYMPLSDWRDGTGHADAEWGSIYALDYLKANISGGEGFDWYYESEAAREMQLRSPIEDGAHGETWVYRYKDLRGWWENPHHERIGGVRQAAPTAWVPRSKPFWFTEYGCAAVDKATNEPNKFLDPKSSESALPRHSTGVRDDLIMAQYYRAMAEFWAAVENNPVSELYGGPMVDMGRAHAWAWDTRPFPQFPGRPDLWSDAANFAKGHWLNGRVGAQPLAAVVAELCARSGVAEVETGELYGLVKGYSVAEVGPARAALQPLMLAYGFDAVERDGRLSFRSRGKRVDRTVGADDLALTREQEASVETVRAPEAEIAGRVRLTHVAAGGDYEARSVEAVFPDERTVAVSQSEIPLVMTEAEGRAVAEQWLAESRVARDTVRFALPPSGLATGAGDVVRLEYGETSALYRIDRVEEAGARILEGIRVDLETRVPSDGAEMAAGLRPFVPTMPVLPVLLELPLMTGDEVPHAPHVAVAGDPWPGSAAVYSSISAGSGYGLNTVVAAPSRIGVTLGALRGAAPGRWDRGAPLRVRLDPAALQSVSDEAIFAGANLAAIGDGTAGTWEVFQFRDAELVAPGEYALSMRLRGQLGTDGIMPEDWPAGSTVVFLDGGPQQIQLSLAARGLERHYRIGPGQRGHEDPSYVHLSAAFAGVGLRPYAPAHLRGQRRGDGTLDLGWVRRTRIDGDSWESAEVPLGEVREDYLVRVIEGAQVRREVRVSVPSWSYTAAMQAADAVAPGFTVAVAQVSETFGPGPFARITSND